MLKDTMDENICRKGIDEKNCICKNKKNFILRSLLPVYMPKSLFGGMKLFSLNVFKVLLDKFKSKNHHSQ
jgi:hypothetical protein